jgi:hypothetical protein
VLNGVEESVRAVEVALSNRAGTGAETVLQADVPLVMELNPKLLRLAGRIDDRAGLLARRYTHVIDLRGRYRPPFEPVDRVESLIARYEAEGRSTEILAVRLPTAS